MLDLRATLWKPSNKLLVYPIVLMKWLLSFLLCASASAQLPVIPYLLPSASIVSDLTDVEYRWVSSDLTTNVAISGNWNDRIQNLAYKQGAVANQPTNSAGGIWFDTTHWLTNFMTVMGSNVAFGYIVKIIDPTGGGGVFPGFSGNSYSGSDGGGRLDLRFNQSINYSLAFEYGQASPSTIGPSGKWSTTNVVFDIVYVQIMTNGNVGGYTCYTNGLLMASGALPTAQLGINEYFGSTSVPNSSDGNLRFLFLNNSRLTSAKLFCLEHWIWTNSPPGAVNGNDINPTDLAHFHKYATNTYGFSP